MVMEQLERLVIVSCVPKMLPVGRLVMGMEALKEHVRTLVMYVLLQENASVKKLQGVSQMIMARRSPATPHVVQAHVVVQLENVRPLLTLMLLHVLTLILFQVLHMLAANEACHTLSVN